MLELLIKFGIFVVVLSIVRNYSVNLLTCPHYNYFPNRISNTPLNNETGPYVASNGSLLLDKALPSDSGVYVCYGIDPITGENATSYYVITVEQGTVSI